MKLHRSTFVSLLIISFVCWQLAQAGWITAKAELAQWLIADAWQQSLSQTGTDPSRHKPWQWADTWPVARLQAPAHNADFYVLEGDSGNALAFGPGRNLSSRLLGEGTTLIGGHRDTHFRFLKNVAQGEPLRVQTLHGQWLNYKIRKREIVDIRQHKLQTNLDQQQLILVTCYPFDTLNTGGPLRLVVTAALIESDNSKRQLERVNTPELDFYPTHADSSGDQLASQYTASSPAIAF
ncbi:MAG: class GN sortase [Cellvibrionaceae bacterium]